MNKSKENRELKINVMWRLKVLKVLVLEVLVPIHRNCQMGFCPLDPFHIDFSFDVM